MSTEEEVKQTLSSAQVRGLITEIRAELGGWTQRWKREGAYTLMVLNEKGGVGKSSIVLHVGAALALLGFRVVIVDADPARGNVTKRLGFAHEPGLYNLIVRGDGFHDVLRYVSPERYAADNDIQDDSLVSGGELYLVPSNPETGAIPTVLGSNLFAIQERFQELINWAQFVIFDTSPAPSTLHTAIYLTADGVIVPTNCSYLSLEGMTETIVTQQIVKAQRQENQLGDLKLLGIVPTCYRDNTVAHEIGVKQMREKFRQFVWNAIPLRTLWEQAEWAAETLYRYAPNAEATMEAWALVRRFARTLKEQG